MIAAIGFAVIGSYAIGYFVGMDRSGTLKEEN
jgi:hypothetical protein